LSPRKTNHQSSTQNKLEGCSEDLVEAKRFEEFARLCIEREKLIYQTLSKHPHILDCVAITEHGLHFPYMRLGNLRQYLQNHTKIIESTVREQWIETAASSITLIHGYGIIHADISVRNFLIADDLLPKLFDIFGSAIGEEDSMILEEDRYHIAPGSPRSTTPDIFTLGCLFFEIATGQRPYNEIDDDEEIQQRYRDGQFPCLKGVLHNEIIYKCWTSQYTSVDELLHELIHGMKAWKIKKMNFVYHWFQSL
jgi:serine/threonine protein kinase